VVDDAPKPGPKPILDYVDLMLLKSWSRRVRGRTISDKKISNLFDRFVEATSREVFL
jgi:hypothetical protein